MRNAVLSVALVSMVVGSSGCYVGRTPSAKTANKVLNTTAIVLGGVSLISGAVDDDPCPSESSCVSQALAVEGAAIVGLVLVGLGVVGLVVNAAVPTRIPDRHDGVIHAGRSTPAVQSQVTAPGLAPATVSIR